MTVVVNETDLEIIESLDFNEALPCESVGDCDKEASWKIIISCCGTLFLFCNDCKSGQIAAIATRPEQTIICGVCTNPVKVKDWILSCEKL